jgi:hypothetical protein
MTQRRRTRDGSHRREAGRRQQGQAGAKQGGTVRPHARHTKGNFVCAQKPSGT